MCTALVTGAAVRVGRAISTALADAGFDLILHAHRSKQELHRLAEELSGASTRVCVHTADLSDPRQVDALGQDVAAGHPRLDLIVQNAAIYEPHPFASITWERYRGMLGINLNAPFFLTQRLLRKAGRAADVATAVVFLATRCTFVTGHVLAVDGGRSVLL